MPELPEVEVVCRALRPVLEGTTFVKVQLNRPDLRYPLPLNLENKLANHSIQAVSRRAKYLLIDFAHGLTLVWHLGMSGRIIIEDLNNSTLEPSLHDHVIITTSNNHKLTYRDPRRFGFLLLVYTNQLSSLAPFDILGPDALNDPQLNAQIFHDRLKRHKTLIKNALLNQKIIAGIGNIYASEALWQAKLSPLRLASTLTLIEATRLLQELQDVLKRAIAAGGSTLKDHVRPNGDVGYFQHSFRAYGRENQPCIHCQSTSIAKIILSRRATYYCKECQH